MFTSTRQRLTIFYTIILSTFLILFIFITSTIFSSIIEHDNRNELTQLLKKEIELHTIDLKEWYHDEEQPSIEISNQPHKTLFYYIVGHDQSIIHGNETRPDLRNIIVSVIFIAPTDGLHIAEYEIKSDEGELLTLAVMGEEVYEDNTFLGWVYVGTDITKQKELYKQLLLLLSIIAIIFIIASAMIANLMAKKAMKPIENAFTQKKNFVADASHELRTPLSVLYSSVQVIDYHDKEHLSTFSKQTLEDMKSEIKRMTTLVEDLLTLARLDNEEVLVYRETFLLSEEAKNVLRHVETVAIEKGITLTQEMQEPINIFGNREQMIRLLYILLDNAIKYIQERGKVKLSIYQTKNKVVVKVSDTGIGISQEAQEKIFERFYRVEQGRNRSLGGTGLGLAIASEIVKAHDGKITVSSEINKGTTFRVELPSHK